MNEWMQVLDGATQRLTSLWPSSKMMPEDEDEDELVDDVTRWLGSYAFGEVLKGALKLKLVVGLPSR